MIHLIIPVAEIVTNDFLTLHYPDRIFKRYYHNGVYTDYLISNYGEIYSEKRNIMLKSRSQKGYKRIDIMVNNKKYGVNVHRMVAIAFVAAILIIEDHEIVVVNHKDGDKLNCYYKNLEWCSHSFNIKHAYDNNLLSKGENNSQSKYSDEVITEACLLIEQGMRFSDIVKILPINYIYLYSLINHRKRRDITSRFDFRNHHYIKNKK